MSKASSTFRPRCHAQSWMCFMLLEISKMITTPTYWVTARFWVPRNIFWTGSLTKIPSPKLLKWQSPIFREGFLDCDPEFQTAKIPNAKFHFVGGRGFFVLSFVPRSNDPPQYVYTTLHTICTSGPWTSGFFQPLVHTNMPGFLRIKLFLALLCSAWSFPNKILFYFTSLNISDYTIISSWNCRCVRGEVVFKNSLVHFTSRSKSLTKGLEFAVKLPQIIFNLHEETTVKYTLVQVWDKISDRWKVVKKLKVEFLWWGGLLSACSEFSSENLLTGELWTKCSEDTPHVKGDLWNFAHRRTLSKVLRIPPPPSPIVKGELWAFWVWLLWSF